MVRATYRSASKKGDAALRPLSFAHHPAGVSVNQRGSVEPLRAGWFVVVVPRHKDNSSDQRRNSKPQLDEVYRLVGPSWTFIPHLPPLMLNRRSARYGSGDCSRNHRQSQHSPADFFVQLHFMSFQNAHLKDRKNYPARIGRCQGLKGSNGLQLNLRMSEAHPLRNASCRLGNLASDSILRRNARV